MKVRTPFKSSVLTGVVAITGAFTAISNGQVVVYDADVSGAPTIVWDGPVGGSGSFLVTYNRTSGTVGPASFTRNYSFTALSKSGDLWLDDSNGPFGVEPNLVSIIGLNGANLPASNQNSITTFPGPLADEVNAAITANDIEWVGTFGLTAQTAPSLAGLTLIAESVNVYSRGNAVSTGGPLLQGIFGQPIGGIQTAAAAGTLSATKQYSHSDSIQFEYTAWDDPGSAADILQNERGLLSLSGAQFTYVVPEPSSILLLGLGSLSLVLRRRRPSV